MQDFDQHLGVLKQHGYRQDEALILLMRLQLIKIINTEITRRQWSQRVAAKTLGVAQPRIAELAALATEKFSVEALIKMLQKLGLKTALKVTPGKHYIRPARLRKAKLKARAKKGVTKNPATRKTL